MLRCATLHNAAQDACTAQLALPKFSRHASAKELAPKESFLILKTCATNASFRKQKERAVAVFSVIA